MINSLSSRFEYKTLENMIYLNQASLGLISDTSINAMHQFLDNIGRHGNSMMTDEEEVNFFDDLRDTASLLFNCSKESLAILSSASEMLNQLPYLIQPKEGEKVILVSTDFPALHRPWLAFSEKRKIKLISIEDERNKDLTESLIAKIDKNTSVIVISYVQFSTGSKVDIKRLRKITKKFDVKLIVDVTQAAGAIPVNSEDWNCDAIICSGYKWLGGHGGVGLAVLSEELINKTPLMPGWMGAEYPFSTSNEKLNLAKSAKRYTQSTMSYVSIKGLEISIKEIMELKIKKIENHSIELKNLFIEKLNNTSWNTFHNKNINLSSSNIVCISDKNKDMKKISSILYQNKIICSYRNNHLRFSFAHYNNEIDVQNCLTVLRSL